MLDTAPYIKLGEVTEVALSAVDEYDVELIKEAVLGQMKLIGFFPEEWKGKRVVLKPNLLLKFDPSRAATVHPTLVQAVGSIFVEAGADVILAESPGGPYNRTALDGIYSVSGMKAAADAAGFELNYDFSAKEFGAPEGERSKVFNIITPIYDADLIVDLCKLKSHSMATMTAGVKNLFGVIPGLEKVQFHARFREMEDFAPAVVDLTSAIASRTPMLTVCDAIVGMEGNGPSGGRPRKIGCILSSMNPFALDGVCAEIIGAGNNVPMLENGRSRGFLPSSPEKYNVLGDSIDRFRISDFEFPDTTKKGILKRLPKFLEPRPVIDKKKCIGCGECARSCPQKTIVIKDRKAHIVKSNCIKCYCCQELCKIQAVRIHKSLIFKLIR